MASTAGKTAAPVEDPAIVDDEEIPLPHPEAHCHRRIVQQSPELSIGSIERRHLVSLDVERPDRSIVIADSPHVALEVELDQWRCIPQIDHAHLDVAE